MRDQLDNGSVEKISCEPRASRSDLPDVTVLFTTIDCTREALEKAAALADDAVEAHARVPVLVCRDAGRALLSLLDRPTKLTLGTAIGGGLRPEHRTARRVQVAGHDVLVINRKRGEAEGSARSRCASQLWPYISSNIGSSRLIQWNPT